LKRWEQTRGEGKRPERVRGLKKTFSGLKKTLTRLARDSKMRPTSDLPANENFGRVSPPELFFDNWEAKKVQTRTYNAIS